MRPAPFANQRNLRTNTKPPAACLGPTPTASLALQKILPHPCKSTLLLPTRLHSSPHHPQVTIPSSAAFVPHRATTGDCGLRRRRNSARQCPASLTPAKFSSKHSTRLTRQRFEPLQSPFTNPMVKVPTRVSSGYLGAYAAKRTSPNPHSISRPARTTCKYPRLPCLHMRPLTRHPNFPTALHEKPSRLLGLRQSHMQWRPTATNLHLTRLHMPIRIDGESADCIKEQSFRIPSRCRYVRC